MDYKLGEDVLAHVKREISRVAASEYDDAGQSLYDSIMLSSRDEAIVEEFLDEAVVRVAARFTDIATRSGTQDSRRIAFNVPDLPSGLDGVVSALLDDYVENYAMASWLNSVCPGRRELYAEKRDAALERAAYVVRTREKVSR